MKYYFRLLILSLLTLHTQAEDLYIWDEGRDFINYEIEDITTPLKDKSLRVTKVEHPSITAFLLDNSSPGPAVLVIPGGAYKHLAYGKAGTEVAAYFNSIGINAFVMKYRVPDNREGAFQDIQRALRYIRENASKWNIDPKRLGVLGSSAGGHLAAKISTNYNEATYPACDETDTFSARPDFSILVFPAYLNENGAVDSSIQVSADTSPTLIIHNHQDTKFIEGSKIYYQALQKAGVSTKAHIFKDGKHGYGLRLDPRMEAAAWPQKTRDWLEEHNIISPLRPDVGKVEKGEKIVFLGDSITQLGAKPGGYVDLVSKELAKKHAELNVAVIGAGVSGNKTPDLLKRLDRDVLSKDPTTVVIYIGINDIWHWTKPHPVTKEPREGTTAHDYATNLRKLITRIHAKGAKVILCTPSVIGEKVDPRDKDYIRLEQYSGLCRNIALETGSQLIDIRKSFIDYLKINNTEEKQSGVLTSDRVHLNDAGNKLVAEEMLIGLALKKRKVETSSPSPTSTENASKDALGFYLCIGQSNMAGRAKLGAGDKGKIKNVYLLDDQGQWAEASHPLNQYSTIRKDIEMQKLSPASSFAKRMTNSGKKVGLIVNAKGGSSIRSWGKGTPFYNEAISRVKLGQKNGKLLGILWHQGERDYEDAAYLEKLVQMIKAFRQDLNMPNLPFVAGQINNIELINQQVSELPNKLDYTAYASSKGLTAQDKWHFDNKSVTELGERYAEAMEKLQGQ